MSKILLDHYKKQLNYNFVDETAHEKIRNQWVKASYSFNQCVTVPLYVAVTLEASESLQQRIITEIVGFISNFGIKDFVEAIHLEIEPDIRGTGFVVELVISEPGNGYRQKARQLFRYNLPPMDDTKRSDIANKVIDSYRYRNRNSTRSDTYEWFYGESYNVNTHVKEDEDALHAAICSLLKDNCKVSLQRLPLALRARNMNSEFYQYHGEVQCWSFQRGELNDYR